MNIPARYQNAKWEDVPPPVSAQLLKMPQTGKGVYLWGGVGSGKTHIAYAFAKYIWRNGGHAAVLNVPEVLREIRMDMSRYEKRRADQEILDYTGLLILDDIGAEKISDWVAELFYLIINRRYVDQRATVFTSNLPIAELAEKIGDRSASRIVEMCEIVHLPGEDRRLSK